jgi:RND family efflux transporter MFP subunit
VPLRLAANGNVAAWQEASIGAESNGLRLTDVRVNVGDTVKAGQVLATFSAETIQADVAQARASLLEAQANAAEAAANAERARSLQATGALSQQQIQQYTTAEKTAQARVEAAQATLNAQQLRLKYTQVVAPDSGVISARTATVGAVVGSGNELFRMVRKGRLEWRAEVTSTELRRIQPGVKASVTAASGATAEGTVRMVAPTVDPQTRNALVYVDLPAGNDFRAGMFARGEFALGQSDALTVPQEALVVRDGFSYIFVVGAEQRVQQRKVQTGRRVADRVELLTGLDGNAQVVVRGAGFLNDGDLVRVAAPAPAAAPAQTTSQAPGLKQKMALTLANQAQAAIN